MLSKDQRNLPGSRERLAGISHHFLSKAEAAPVSEAHGPAFLPVLLDDSSRVRVVHRIARALTTRQCPSTVVYVERRMQQAAAPGLTADIDRRGLVVPLTRRSDWQDSDTARLRLLSAVSARGPAHRFCLIPVCNRDTPVLGIADRLLVPVAPTLESLCYAYAQIKQLSRGGTLTAGVTIIDCDSEADARIYFDKLAVAALRFLGQRLMYCGYLRKEAEREDAADPASRDITGISPELREVTSHILHHHLYVSFAAAQRVSL